jgi:uncharacterized membrane protein YgcG
MVTMFKKLLVILFLFFSASLLIASKVTASSGYTIKNFQSTVEVEKDTSILVEERILTEFTLRKHGIFRYIPLYHSSLGKTIKTPAEVLSVVDGDGNPHTYDVSRKGGNLEVKIGEPDRYIQGKKTYVITYRAKNVIRDYEGVYELYWNALGSGWDTDILASSVKVVSPHAKIEKVKCFTGKATTGQSLCSIDQTENEIFVQADTRLGGSKDLTVVAGLDKDGGLAYPSFVKRAYWFFEANWGYLVAVLPLGIIFYLWRKKGRDKRYISENVYYKPDNVATKTVSLFSRKHLPLVYHPIDGLSPSEVGTIIDERVQTHDVIAEIVELARLGFLGVKKIDKKEYAFIKKKKLTEKNLKGLKNYQKQLLKGLFKKSYMEKSASKTDKKEFKEKKLEKGEFVLLSVLKNKFYTVFSEVKKDLYERMQKEGFFAGNPEKVRIKWLVVYLIIASLCATAVFWFTQIANNPFPTIAFIFLSSIGGVLSWFMPRRTPKGYSLLKQTQGLRECLKKGKWKYEHMEKSLFFEEILPLAISLKVVDQLTKDMDDLGVKPPHYTGATKVGTFNLYFGNFYSNSSRGLVSAPSSSSWSGGSGFSGGGSVGGGFGGGGGGSW